MKHLKQIIEEGNLNDAIRLYLECNKKIKCIHEGEVVELPVDDLEDYEVEDVVGEIELDEDSEVELVSVRTHIAFIRLAYDPDYEVIADMVDETEFINK